MKKLIVLALLTLGLVPATKADEIFYATSYTGTVAVGSTVDISMGNPQTSWTLWGYVDPFTNGVTYYYGYGPQNYGTPGDPGASLTSPVAVSWVLQFSHWESGIGYAVLEIDTNWPPGVYYVGNVNSTGGAIWVVLS